LGVDAPRRRFVPAVRASGAGLAVERTPDAIADAIGALIDDPQMASEMGQRGRRFYEANGAPEAVAAWHERLYESLLPATGEGDARQ
jgi:hypothetical protein